MSTLIISAWLCLQVIPLVPAFAFLVASFRERAWRALAISALSILFVELLLAALFSFLMPGGEIYLLIIMSLILVAALTILLPLERRSSCRHRSGPPTS